MPPLPIVLVGPPASGKGTQAARLSSNLNIPAISTGEILRREEASGSETGRLLQNLLVSGRLVSDEVVMQVVQSRLAAPDCGGGFILDGYPRTVVQARQLDRLLGNLSFPEPLVFELQISTATVLFRLAHRLECPTCGRTFHLETVSRDSWCDQDGSRLVRRADDKPTSIKKRLQLYSKNAVELAQYYAGRKYFRVRGATAAEALSVELLRIIAAFRTHLSHPQSAEAITETVGA